MSNIENEAARAAAEAARAAAAEKRKEEIRELAYFESVQNKMTGK